jgi:hypothetical protein
MSALNGFAKELGEQPPVLADSAKGLTHAKH